MSSWEASEPAGKGVAWCVKPRSSDDPAPKVCCLCAPPPLCYAVFTALAIAEIVLASLAGHILGICVGCSGVLVSLFACGVSTRWKPQRRIRMTLLFFGVLFLTVWIILLAAIRVVGDSDSTFDTFPSSCSLPDGCTRVAFSEGGAQGTHRCSMDGAQCKVPKVAALATTVREDVVKELDSWFQTRVVKDDPNYVHAVILSVVWGFPDDFGVELMCNSSMTQLFIQSEQRIGTTDGGVNEGHVTKFLGWFQSHTMPAGICTTP